MRSAPHPFTLRQLQYVVAVAEERSFRRAADRCGVSQPSLSAQIAQLEGALGAQFFERARRPLIPTAAGAELVERAARLLVLADDLAVAVRRAGDPLAGTMRLGVIPTISPYLLPRIAPALRKRFPRLAIAWLEDKTETLARYLFQGTVDAAIVALEEDVGDVEQEVIATDPFVLVVPRGHDLAAKAAAVRPSALRGQPLLLLDEGHCFRKQALEVCGAARESEFRATSLSTLVQMVAGGAGITLLPALAVPTEARRASLGIRPLASPAAHRTVGMIWRRRSPRDAALRQITAVMRSAYPAAEP